MGLSVVVVLVLVNTGLAIIDNRKPEANYVIPIEQDKSAVVYCVSHFAKPIVQKLGPGGEKENQVCDPCKDKVKKIRYRCCKAVSWEQVERPMKLRCTTRGPGWPKEDKNTPQILVSVVRKVSRIRGAVPGPDGGPLIANSSTVFFCHNISKASHVIAGSHIGLGWMSHDGKYEEKPTTKPEESSFTDKSLSYDQLIEGMIDDKKVDKLENMYNHPGFEKLWISNDMRLEMKPHNYTFKCNETDYYLPTGSRCMTPSSRAIFVMTNCRLVEQIFIVIGVIALLVIAYIVFNVMVWSWNYFWNKKHQYDDSDDLTVLKSEIET